MFPRKHTASKKKDEKKNQISVFRCASKYLDIWLCTGFQELKMYYANPWTLHTWIIINCNSVSSAANSGNYWLLLKPVLRKELSSVLSVCIIIFLSIFLYWLLLETLKWDGWGSVWPICWVPRYIQSCSVLNTLLTASHLSVNDNFSLSAKGIKTSKPHRRT